MITRAALARGELVWLLTLTLRGRVYRFSTRQAEIADGGYTRLYLPGLADGITWRDAVPAPGETAEESAVSVELRFTRDSAAGWAALAAGDGDLGDAQGELALWLVGSDLSQRERLIRGPIRASAVGALEEPIQISLGAAPWRDAAARLPPDEATASEETWPAGGGLQLGDGVAGLQYPQIVGAPGWAGADDISATYPAVPVLLVEIDDTTLDNSTTNARVLIGDGLLRAAGSVSVKLHNATTGATSAALTPVADQDATGRAVTVLSVSAAQLGIDDGDELWATFASVGTSAVRADSGASLRRAPDVILWLLRASGAVVDWRQIMPALRAVRGYVFDGYLNSSIDPIEVLLGQILPLLPLTWRVGAGGLEILTWPYGATPAQAVAHLDLSVVAGDRLGLVGRSDPQEIVNLQTIRFCPHGPTGAYLGAHTLAPARRADQPDRETHPYARASAQRYGEREGPEIVTDWIVDIATARRCLVWRLRWYSQSRERVTYQLPQEWQALRPLQPVTITDAELGWTERLFVVESVIRRPGPTEITFVQVPDWIRDGVSDA